ncbi:MAG: hypothetical protein MI922_09240, partial [Bacteroidales bacterium]|nr:hypothetical protein [Bacteroidales bacterium]
MENYLEIRVPVERSGTNKKDRAIHQLMPDYINIEERSIEDFKSLVANFAKNITFIGDNNKVSNLDWEPFFSGDTSELEKQPHYALFLAFLKILEYSKANINSFTKRYLDYYYQQVLQFTKKNEIPDNVHVIMELAKNIQSHTLRKGELFYAGKDQLGNPLYYSLHKDTELNKTKIVSINTLFLQSDDKIFKIPLVESGTETSTTEEQTEEDDNQNNTKDSTSDSSDNPKTETGKNSSAESLASTGEAQEVKQGENPTVETKKNTEEEDPKPEPEFIDYPLPNISSVTSRRHLDIATKTKDNSAWNILGKKAPMKANADTSIIQTEIGFAIASPILVLNEGTRNVKLEFKLNMPENDDDILRLINMDNFSEDDFIILYSNEDKWEEITRFVPEIDKERVLEETEFDKIIKFNVSSENQTQGFLELNLNIPFHAPAFKAYTGNDSMGQQSEWPMIKILLNPKSENFRYTALKTLKLISTHIKVKVKGIRNLVLQNDQALINPGKPFEPFGSHAPVGSNFYIGSAEIFSKTIN